MYSNHSNKSVLSLTKPLLWIGWASNEKCQSKPHSLKNKSPQNLEKQRRQARKTKPKQNARYDKTRKEYELKDKQEN